MMVLDTHVWIRWVDPTNMPLPAELVERIETSDQLAISAISCWELAMLVRRGRVQVSLPLDQWIDMALSGSGVTCLPVERQTASLASLDDDAKDRVDAFCLRFLKLQDTLGKPVFRSLLALELEDPENLSQLDILNKMEKRGIVESVEHHPRLPRGTGINLLPRA